MRRSQALRKLMRRQRRPSELQLVSMIDIFTVLVTFLLMTAIFSRTVVLDLRLPSNNASFPELPKGAGKIDKEAPKTFTETKSGLKYRVLRKGEGARLPNRLP